MLLCSIKTTVRQFFNSDESLLVVQGKWWLNGDSDVFAILADQGHFVPPWTLQLSSWFTIRKSVYAVTQSKQAIPSSPRGLIIAILKNYLQL